MRIFRPIANINSKFVNFYFLTNLYKSVIRKLMAGSNINNLKDEYINNVLVPSPPLLEQERIVKRIED